MAVEDVEHRAAGTAGSSSPVSRTASGMLSVARQIEAVEEPDALLGRGQRQPLGALPATRISIASFQFTTLRLIRFWPFYRRHLNAAPKNYRACRAWQSIPWSLLTFRAGGLEESKPAVGLLHQ